MHILLATPFFTSPWDNGRFWIHAFSKTGHTLTVWDYRLEHKPPECDADLTFVMKGTNSQFTEAINPEILPGKTACLFPDFLQFYPNLQPIFKKYDRLFTTPIPTPELDWCVWAPGRYEPLIHRDLGMDKKYDTIYVGTLNSAHKEKMIKEIEPDLVYGDGWVQDHFKHSMVGPAKYLFDYTRAINEAKIAVCVFSPEWGPCPKPFEMCRITFTLIEKVPGVPEIFDKKLLDKVGFVTVKEAKEKVNYYLENEEERLELFEKEKEAVAPYTYSNTIEQVLKEMGG